MLAVRARSGAEAIASIHGEKMTNQSRRPQTRRPTILTPVCARRRATLRCCACAAVAGINVAGLAGAAEISWVGAPATPVELVQKGCVYAPRVMGVRVGQPIDVVNADATMHNVHALPMVNQEFNKSQPLQNSHMTHVFTAPEVMVRFMCNVHSWMSSYVGVMEHPYFAVSDEAGRFEIKNLPPGTYTIEAWHEKFGRRTVDVTVADKQPQTAAFTFTADAKSESK
jgi:plastocyanin